MPVTETEAAVALRYLPSDCWLRRYAVHGFKQTTAPLVYHIGVGLTTLGVTTPSDYGMHFAGTLRANNYALLVGRSGADQKSTALGVGRSLLAAAASKLIGNRPGSREGLIDSLALNPTQLLPISEFGEFLSAAQGGYFEPIKALMADAWDCGALQRACANNRIVRVDNPRLSITAACSIPYLEQYTLSTDWTGGFMGRWMVLYGRAERKEADPVGDTTDTQWLIDELKLRVATPVAGWCTGLDNPSKLLWESWYNELMDRKLPDNIVGINSRAPTIARKIALILGWDYGPALRGKPWRMDLSLIEPAIAITELHLTSLIHLSDAIAEHPEARQRRSVLRAIDQQGGTATLGEILAILKMKKRTIIETIDALIEEKRVAKVTTSIGEGFEHLRIV